MGRRLWHNYLAAFVLVPIQWHSIELLDFRIVSAIREISSEGPARMDPRPNRPVHLAPPFLEFSSTTPHLHPSIAVPNLWCMTQTHCYYPKDLLNEHLYDTACLIAGLQLSPDAPDYIIITLIPFNPRQFSELFEEQLLRIRLDGRVVFSWDQYPTMVADVSLRQLRRRRRRKTKKRPTKQIIEPVDDSMVYFLLGFVNHQSAELEGLPLNFVYNNLTKYPILTNIQHDLKVILFDVPDPRVMQYYLISPIEILDESHSYSETPPSFADKMRFHGGAGAANAQERNFGAIIQALNECYFYRLVFYNAIMARSADAISVGLRVTKPWEQSFSLSRSLQNARIFVVSHLYILPSYGGARHRRKRSKSRSMKNITPSKFPEIITYEDSTLAFARAERVFKVVVIHLVIGVRLIIELLFTVLNWRFRQRRLVEMSLTAQQIDLRLQQLCLIPSQFIKIKQRHNLSDFIRLYNTIWLIFNDIIFGFTVGQYVYEYLDSIRLFVEETIIKELLYNTFYKLTLWLMNFPAGFKLNLNLAVFFGELFLWIIDFFFSKVLMSGFFARYVIPGCISLIAYGGGIFGATFILLIACDFINFVTLHIFCFYFALAKIFKWLLVILKSLFNLFYGKKNNVLKKRIDSADYTLDQLLLGTLLFTITLFILPTVLAFYLSFMTIRLAILALMLTLEAVLACLNHFPIFAVLLRIKDQFRVPGGINFRLLNFINEELTRTWETKGKADYLSEEEYESDSDESYVSEEEKEPALFFNDGGNIIYLELKNEPLSYKKIFLPYILLWNKIKHYYLSTSTLKSLFTGTPISVSRNRLYHLLYLMLPMRPIETKVLYRELKEHYL